MPQGPAHAIILYDGVCAFCNAGVNFIIAHDPAGYFRFAPRQSPAGQEVLRGRSVSAAALKSILLIEDGQLYNKSEAALRIARRLQGFVRLVSFGIAIPSFLREAVYDCIALNRHRWVGKAEACPMPNPALAARFLDTVAGDATHEAHG